MLPLRALFFFSSQEGEALRKMYCKWPGISQQPFLSRLHSHQIWHYDAGGYNGGGVLFEVRVRQWNSIQEVKLELQMNAFKDLSEAKTPQSGL